jgi:hypothetical protein
MADRKRTVEECVEAYRRHKSLVKAGAELGVSRTAIARALAVGKSGQQRGAALEGQGSGQQRGAALTGPGSGKERGAALTGPGGMKTVSLADIRKKMDPMAKVLDVLAGVPSGELVPRHELVAKLGMNKDRARRVLNAPVFAERRVMLRNVLPFPDGMYFGSKADIGKITTDQAETGLY